MTERWREAMKAAGATAVGAGGGAAISGTIGGIGVAATGTAVGVTLGPFIVIGTGLGATAYGICWLGKRVGAANRPD